MLLGSVKNILVLCETWLLEVYQFTLIDYRTINLLGTFDDKRDVTVLIKNSLNILKIEKRAILNCNSILFKIKSNELPLDWQYL